jgi:glycosyltransferase involved in cell wall biosynthesis
VSTTLTPHAFSSAEPAGAAALSIRGIRDPRSVGVGRYAAQLAEALDPEGIAYELAASAARDEHQHFHLANSSRALLRTAPGGGRPLVVTVHDVVPRARALLPLYRLLAYPRMTSARTTVIAHTRFAADLLMQEAGGRAPARLEIIPHPARRAHGRDRAAARLALSWPDDALIAVVPGVIRPVKLVREALAAVAALHGWHLALAGRPANGDLVRAARRQGALVLEQPDDADYERALVAADAVLCLRDGSVGETNGPLLDALGAGRAVLATASGSIPEVAADAVRYCDGTELGVRAGLSELADPSVRAELERAAQARAAGLSWAASAHAHACLFREVFDS